MKKRSLSLLLALCIVLTLLPMSAFAATATSGTCGDNATWTLDSDGTLTISGAGDMYLDEDIPWYSSRGNVETIIIKNGITSIGDCAFFGCDSLTSVDIPESVTSIGEGAFECCTSLTNIEIPDSVTSIGNYAFGDCDSLTSVTIGDSVTSIGNYAFEDCDSLTSVTIGNSVTSIDRYAFYNCDSLTSVTIGNSVTSIGEGAFYGCTSLTNIEIPDSVTSIDRYAFYNCDSLTSVTIGDSVTSIGNYAFEDCDSLTSVTIGDSVTSIGDYAFQWCSSLTDVYYGGTSAQWNALKEACYEGNNPLFNANLHPYETGTCGSNATWEYYEGVLTISGTGDMYDYKSKGAPWYSFMDDIETVIIQNGVTNIGEYAFYGCHSLKSITIGNSVTSIDRYAFYNCDSLTSIDIPDSVTSIGDYAFCDCYDLTSIEIPDSVTSIGVAAFCNCSGLTEINYNAKAAKLKGAYNDAFFNAGISGRGITVIFGESVEEIPSNLFYVSNTSYSPKITSVTIPESVTSIGSRAFYNCDSLRDVYYGGTIEQWNVLKGSCYEGNMRLFDANIHIHEMGTCGNNATWEYYDGALTISGTGDMYDYKYQGTPWYSLKDNVKTVTIQNGITSVGDDAFDCCCSLTDVQIGNSVTSIGDYAFCDCYDLTSIEIPDSVTSIGVAAFSYCGNLTSIEIPDSVTSIGSGAFGSCYRLTSVEIPDSVTSIGDWAFSDCGLKAINVNSKNISYSSIDGVLFNKGKTRLVQYPCGKLDKSYTIPDSVTSLGSGAFFDCDRLTSITIPDSVTNIENSAFRDCFSLTSIEIPDSVTSIGDYAFDVCENLTSVTIPDSVTSIGNYAFQCCDSLKDVYYGGTSIQWNALKAACYQGNGELFDANIHFKVSIVEQPEDITALSGTTGTFGISTEGDVLTYQWQYLKPDSTTWINSTSSSGKTDTLSVNVREAIAGYKYRCIVKDKNNKTLTSKVVTLTVLPKAAITKHPANITTLNGTTCTFSITATGTGLKYQWQYIKPNEKTWIDSTSTSAKTDTLTVNARDAINGYMYRCVVKDSAGNTATSNVATLTVKPYLQISKQPTDSTAASGTIGKFSITADGVGLTYQWQYQKPDSATWTNSTVPSANRSTLWVNVREAINGYKYRCVVSDSNSNKVTSSEVKLTVMPAITTQPADLTAGSGTTCNFSVTATGEGLTYQWQYQKPNSSKWINSTSTSAKTDILSINVREEINGYKYRCVVTNSCGNSVTSSTAILTVVPNIIKQPTDLTAASGTVGKFNINVTGNGLTYQWQYLKLGGSWTNSTSTSAKTATFSVNAREAINGYKYRCIVTNSCGNSVTSNTVTLTVKSVNEIELVKLPTDITAANGTIAKFSITATGSGLTYQWQYQKPDTATWVNSTSTSGTTATFSVNARTAIDGYKYRCIVKDSAGNSVTSNVVTLTVK